MTRGLKGRLHISGRLVAVTALHVGGLDGDDALTDLPLARDGLGRVYLPGTSLAGALRALATEVLADRGDLLDELFGPPTRPADTEPADAGSASRVTIADATATARNVREEIRDGVGIDRVSGAAAFAIKFDRAVVPAGTAFRFGLVLEVPAGGSGDELQAALAAVLQAAEEPWSLGAARTRGLGQVKLTELAVDWRGLARDELLGWLAGGRGSARTLDDLRAKATTVGAAARQPLRITVAWQPRGPLMVNAGMDGSDVDQVPLVTGTADGNVALVLPGGSIKGALRTRAELILRTVLGVDGTDVATTPAGFLGQLEEPALDLVHWLFGLGGQPAENASAAVDGRQKGLGALAVADCLAPLAVTRAQWQAIVNAPNEAAFRTARDAAGLSGWAKAMHVAVDRWTGGAAENLLFSVLEPFGVAWKPIELTVDLGRLPESKRDAALALLLFVLRDFATGAIPLGFGVNRGLGDLAVTDITLQGTLVGLPVDLPEQLVAGGEWKLDGDAADYYTQAWNAALNGGANNAT